MNLIARLVRETEGQDLIEYALFGTVVGLTVAVSMSLITGGVIRQFRTIAYTITPTS